MVDVEVAVVVEVPPTELPVNVVVADPAIWLTVLTVCVVGCPWAAIVTATAEAAIDTV